ncbi:MAG TPA: multiubiquitin domain-containing protein [Chthoniobacterales bacterium]|jgi:hypothetical protein
MQTKTEHGSHALNNTKENGKFRFSISDEHFNFSEVEIADRKPTGAQIVKSAGVHPVNDFVVLQHLKSGELESLRPTEITDLGEKGVERFFVIKGSMTYRFTVDALSMEWPRKEIAGKHAKALARVDADSVLVLDVPEGERVIGDDDLIDLSPMGTEELRIRKKPRLVTVIYNQEQKFKLESRVYTTEELMEIFKVPGGYKLDLVSDGFRELVPQEKVPIAEGMEFASHPPVGQSS